MHIKSPFIITFPLVIPCLFAAPIYEDSRSPLVLIARTVTPVPVSGHPMPNNRLSPHTSNTHASNSQLRVAASPDNTASRLSKLNLNTKFTPGFQKGSASLLSTGKSAPCPGKGSSTVCHSSSSSGSNFPYGRNHEGSEISVHPEGKNGPDTNAVKKLTVGHVIGTGKESTVYSVPKHEFGHADLAAKVYYHKGNPTEADNLRKLGQLHASGKCNGHDCLIMQRAKGVSLMQTDAYQKADKIGGPAVSKVLDHGDKLIGDARFNHMQKTGLIHNAVSSQHVKFEVNAKGEPVKANLVGWGNAIQAPKRGPEEVYHPELEGSVRSLHHFRPPFEFPSNKRIGSQPVLPPDPKP